LALLVVLMEVLVVVNCFCYLAIVNIIFNFLFFYF
jgi:hypothetical protein